MPAMENTNENNTEIIRDSIPLRLASALLPSVDGEITHQTVKNRREKSGDQSLITLRWLNEERRKGEILFLKVNALAIRRQDFVRDYYNLHGKLPTEAEVKQAHPFSEVLEGNHE